MPSVFTIEGTSKKPKRKKRRGFGDAVGDCTLGECKDVYNPRTKQKRKLCCVGKSESKSGWKFTKNGGQ